MANATKSFRTKTYYKKIAIEWWHTYILWLKQLVIFITCDMQPLSVVKNAGFKQLMHTAEPYFKVQKRPVQSVVKVELTNMLLHDKEKNQ